MTTASAAYTVLRNRLAANTSLPIRWRGDDTDSAGSGDLPDTPTTFLFCWFEPMPAVIAGFGGGRGANLYRNQALLNIFVFVPRGDGSETVALDHGETIAAIFRSFRDSDVSCFGASVLSGGPGSDIAPPGLRSEVNLYSFALIEVELHFDQTG